MARTLRPLLALTEPHTAHGVRLLAWSIWLLAIGALVLSLFAWVAQGLPAPPLRFIDNAGGAAVVPAAMWFAGVFATMGLFLARHRRHSPIGWIFLLLGTGMALTDLANRAIVTGMRAGSIGMGHELVAWAISSFVLPFNGVLLVVFLLIFPDGRPASPAWWRVGWLALGAGIAGGITAALEPGELFWYPLIRNPINPPEALRNVLIPMNAVLLGGALLSLALATYALVDRYREADQDRRRQLKWVAYAGAVLAAAAVPYMVTRYLMPDSAALGTFMAVVIVAATLLPVATARAVTRHRLYEIDLLINRTLAYAMLTGLLGALFGALTTILQRFSIAVSGEESDVALAVSTVVVASLVGPVGRVIEMFVDQRFNPSRRTAPAPTAHGHARAIEAEEGGAPDLADITDRLVRVEEELRGLRATAPPKSGRTRR